LEESRRTEKKRIFREAEKDGKECCEGENEGEEAGSGVRIGGRTRRKEERKRLTGNQPG
jgi:hypothetical protein